MLLACMLTTLSVSVVSISLAKGVELMPYANWLLLLAGLMVMLEQKKK